MAVEQGLDTKRIQELDRQYVLHSWSVQNQISPLVVTGGEGRYFWDADGNRYLDFASQLVNVSIGHQHPKVVAAIKEQADKLTTIGPADGARARSELARLLAEVHAGDLTMSFFTNGGAEANENAIKLARWYTGRDKIVARYRSYHGATAGRSRSPATRGAGPPSRGSPASSHARPLHVPLPRRASRIRVPVCTGGPAPRGDPPVRRPAERRSGHPRDDRRHERDHRPARRLPAVDPRGLRPAWDSC
jgi:taurine--2-oxoglutarate transaminase